MIKILGIYSDFSPIRFYFLRITNVYAIITIKASIY